MRFFCKITLLFLCAFFLSCKNDSDVQFVLRLPEWPPADDFCAEYPRLTQWNIVIVSSYGEQSLVLPPSEKSVCVQKDCAAPVAVLAYPVTEEICFFKPAGCILPYEKSFSWQGGFCADIFAAVYKTLCLEQGGHMADYRFADSRSATQDAAFVWQTVASFNWERFIEVLAQKSGSSEVPYNPWNLDRAKILGGICGRSFSALYLNQKNCFCFEPQQCIAEVFAGKTAPSLFLSYYVPANSFCNVLGGFSVSSGQTAAFWVCGSESPARLATVTVSAKGVFSLALNSLPL